jgi:C4-dicarboxylate transporter DctM subunit
MGVISPPVGINTYVVNGIAKDVPLETVFKGVLPFLAALVVGTAIIIAFPIIVTLLPDMIK